MGKVLGLTVVIGVVAGLRAMMPVAAVTWGARLRARPLDGTHLGRIGGSVSPWVFGLLALGELVNDKLPATHSRKVPLQV